MFIRLLSDVHNEFGWLKVPVIPNEKEIVLVLAGDIGVPNRPATIGPFLHEMCERHRAVIYVFGNHEHYDSSLIRTRAKLERAILGWSEYKPMKTPAPMPPNLFVLENETMVIDDVAFIGSTLWTDFDKGNPVVMMAAENRMNDYKAIRTGTKVQPYRYKLVPHTLYRLHSIAKEFLFSTITEQKNLKHKAFVISHHAPCSLSIPDHFRGDQLNSCYTSDLSNEILDTSPEVWVHGHIHNNADYQLGDTRIVCNPRGYDPDYLNPQFNPSLLIEI